MPKRKKEGLRPSKRVVASVVELLGQMHGRPRLGNPDDPVTDLLYILLSNRTAPAVCVRVFEDVLQRFPTWDVLLDAGQEALCQVLQPAGLAEVRSRNIIAALERIRTDFGEVDLRPLALLTEEEALGYLTSLPGVSGKVARCVMMYTLGFDVLPVDVHVHRVSTRLGWTKRKRPDQCHEELEAVVPPALRYAFHVTCVAHGRSLCLPSRPLCGLCCVNQFCQYANAAGGKSA